MTTVNRPTQPIYRYSGDIRINQYTSSTGTTRHCGIIKIIQIIEQPKAEAHQRYRRKGMHSQERSPITMLVTEYQPTRNFRRPQARSRINKKRGGRTVTSYAAGARHPLTTNHSQMSKSSNENKAVGGAERIGSKAGARQVGSDSERKPCNKQARKRDPVRTRRRPLCPDHET